MSDHGTFWNSEPTPARRVRVIVADDANFPRYWARVEGLIGKEVAAVEVTYYSKVFYLYDEPVCERPDCGCGLGPGWQKVTNGRGSPQYGHKSLTIERVVDTSKAR